MSSAQDAAAEAMAVLRWAGSHPIVGSFPQGAIIVFDADLRFVSAGGLGLAEVGLSREILEGNTIFQVFPPEVVAVIEPLYRQALAGVESSMDVPYEGRIFLQRLGPLRDAVGGIVAGMGFTQDVTEMRQAARALRESEERFRLGFDHSPTPMILIALDGGAHQVNPAMCTFIGYPAAQLTQMSMADISHPDDLAADSAAMAGLIAAEQTSYTLDKRFITGGGAVVWGTKSAAMVRGQDGAPLQVIVQIQDITARKQQEQWLAEEHRRLRDAESIGRVGSWELDLLTEAVSWSAGLFELYGLDPDEFDGDYASALNCIHPDDRADIDARVEACARTGEPFHGRYRITRGGDGSLRWIDARGEAHYEGGRPVRLSGAIADITDQVAAQAFQQAVFAASPDTISVWDFASRSILWTNRSIPEMLGYTGQDVEAMGGSIGAVVPAEDRVRSSAALAAAQEAPGDEVVHVDYRMVAKDGTTRWFSQRTAPLDRDEDGRVTQLVGVLRDTTEQVATQTAMQEKDALFNQLAGSVDVGFSVRSIDPPAYLYVSPGFEKVYGYNPMDEQEDPGAMRRVVHPDDYERIRTGYWAAAAVGVRTHAEYRIRRPDGEIRWVRATSGPVIDADGVVRRTASTAEDVTEQVMAAQEASANHAFHQAVIGASPDLVFVYNLATRTTTWSNRSLLEQLGYPAASNIGIDSLVPEDEQSQLLAAMAAAAESADAQIIQLDHRLRAADGTDRWFSRRMTAMRRDHDGRTTELVGVLRDITAAVAAEQHLRHTALHDSLTGLPNRALLMDRLNSALTRSGHTHREVSVLFCDLDGFKRVNDSAGHSAGDQVLLEIADRLKGVLRAGDTVARIGGDEFVIIVEPWNRTESNDQPVDSAADRALATRVADRVGVAVRQPITIDGVEHGVSVSIGITHATQPDGGSAATLTAEQILQNADTAMYRAKSGGKDRFEVFEPGMRADVAERGRVERTLREALRPTAAPGHADPLTAAATAVLSAAYQPIFDAATGTLVGFEALARLADANGLIIAPDVFIPVAEDTGLIHPVGTRMLDLACGQLATWLLAAPGHANLTMAVNMSALQAQHSSLADDVHRALTKHGLPPSALVLELTESTLLDAANSTIKTLKALHGEGIGIAIDDFGTGYASLRYLATLPISALKVDRSFTCGLPEDSVSRKIVNAVAGLAADLDLACIVEGVETQAQRNALPGGVQLQGYLTGRPQQPHLIDVPTLAAGRAVVAV